MASVTAGLKCPPETCPTAKIAASSPNPKPRGTATITGDPVAAAASTDIEPTNTNMKVPTASARYLLIDTDTSFAGNSPIQDIDPVDAGPGLS